MQDDPVYDDVVSDVKRVPRGAARVRGRGRASARSTSASIPGSASGRRPAHNFELVRRLDELVAIGRPVLIGFSRKSSLGEASATATRRSGRSPRPSARPSPPTSAARRSCACTTCASMSRRLPSRGRCAAMIVELRGLRALRLPRRGGGGAASSASRSSSTSSSRWGSAAPTTDIEQRRRLPRGRRGRARVSNARASTCSRRSPPRSRTRCSSASRPSRVQVRVRKPQVRPAGLTVEFSAVTVERP